MNILKVINNNVVSAINEKEKEVVVMGKGIGFQKKTGDLVEPEKIEKIFSLTQEHTGQYEELVKNMSYEHMSIAQRAIAYASEKLNRKLNQSIYITLTDHLNFAIERQKTGITLRNALLWEIKKFYPEEFGIGLDVVEMVKKELGVALPEDEAGFLALHVVNAEMEKDNAANSKTTPPTLIKDILNIVQYSFQEELDEGTLSYERFMTHLKFFVQRTINNSVYDENDMELYEMLKKRYPKAHQCALKIKQYLEKTKGYPVPETEVSYLTAHIARITRL